MESGLRIEIIPDDDLDLLRIKIFVCNDSFSGATEFYSSSDVLLEVAECLSGFPSGGNDERTCLIASPYEVSERRQYGAKTRGRFAKGRCSIVATFEQLRGTAHVCLEGSEFFHTDDCVSLTFPIEALSIDMFVSSLRNIASTREGEARLLTSV